MTYPKLFNSYQPLKGKDWIKNITPEDLAVFINIGREAHQSGQMGGTARAKTCKRDTRGRFARNDYQPKPTVEPDQTIPF